MPAAFCRPVYKLNKLLHKTSGATKETLSGGLKKNCQGGLRPSLTLSGEPPQLQRQNKTLKVSMADACQRNEGWTFFFYMLLLQNYISTIFTFTAVPSGHKVGCQSSLKISYVTSLLYTLTNSLFCKFRLSYFSAVYSDINKKITLAIKSTSHWSVMQVIALVW